ncbi:MAG: sigma-70 family RNA polymerase sigma factor [Acidimicrobiales bacterium]
MAFERYVVPELDVLYRVARSRSSNSADAEDLVQDTLLRAYRAVDRFDGRYPRAWLLTILRNTQINRARKRTPDLLDDPDMTLGRLESDSSESPEASVVDTQFEAELSAALDALPEKFRVVVDLVDIGGASYQEAAAVLELPVGTIMSRLPRARKRMRAQLTGKAQP